MARSLTCPFVDQAPPSLAALPGHLHSIALLNRDYFLAFLVTTGKKRICIKGKGSIDSFNLFSLCKQ